MIAGNPILNMDMLVGIDTAKTAIAVIMIARTTKYFCSGEILDKNVYPPNASATAPNVNRLIIFAPNTLPIAIAGFGGSTSVTADMLVASSGKEVAKATRMLPTKSLPNPVNSANASPYSANLVPQNMTTPALAKNINTGIVN